MQKLKSIVVLYNMPLLTQEQVDRMKANDEVALILTGQPSPTGWILFCRKANMRNKKRVLTPIKEE
jgi:hypothetical protein